MNFLFKIKQQLLVTIFIFLTLILSFFLYFQFNKKKEYEGSSLYINDSNNDTQFNYLIGLDNEIIKDQNALTKKIDNKIINELFY